MSDTDSILLTFRVIALFGGLGVACFGLAVLIAMSRPDPMKKFDEEQRRMWEEAGRRHKERQ